MTEEEQLDLIEKLGLRDDSYVFTADGDAPPGEGMNVVIVDNERVMVVGCAWSSSGPEAVVRCFIGLDDPQQVEPVTFLPFLSRTDTPGSVMIVNPQPERGIT